MFRLKQMVSRKEVITSLKMQGWRNGSRNGLKIRWSQGREGSNPSPRTNI